MKTLRLVWLVVVAWVSWGHLGYAADLQEYKNAELVAHDIADGDSFIVNANGQTLHVRLYFVDCPETVLYQSHDARRVQEQARYFGLDNPERIMWLGKQSADFTKVMLARPFTLYTSHAKALGGRTSNRIYGFVVTSTGRDLGELLVENGLARSFGVKRERYDGVTLAEAEMRMRDLESAAMLARRGVWQESNPNRIAEYRAQQRAEAMALNALMHSTAALKESPLNINTATQSELERVPGIGPVTADRIIKNRPFTTVEDLRTVQGIGGKTFENIRPYLKVNGTTNGSSARPSLDQPYFKQQRPVFAGDQQGAVFGIPGDPV